MKINCDLQLTLMVSSIYRLPTNLIGQGHEHAIAREHFSDFVDATALLDIDEPDISMHFHGRAHSPYLIEAGFDKLKLTISWLEEPAIHVH